MMSLFVSLCVLIILTHGSVFAGDIGKNPITPAEYRAKQESFNKLPKEKQDEIRAERAQKRLQRTGGLILDIRRQQGAVLVINAQKSVSKKMIWETMKKLEDYFRFKINIEDAETVDADASKALLKSKNANLVLYIVDTCGKSIMLVSPEECWAMVNIRALGDKNLESRAKKEVVRAFIYLCGGIASTFPHPMTHPVCDARALDLIENADIPVDVLTRINKYSELMGITASKFTTYKKACEEGWAPAPTNEFQQAIWDKVKAEQNAAPTSPIRILPGQKPSGR